MSKTIFNAESIVSPSWFNSIQNIRFVKNPNSDGEYPLLQLSDIQSDVLQNKFIGVLGGVCATNKTFTTSPSVEGGNFATLGLVSNLIAQRTSIFSSNGTLQVSQSGSSIQINSTTKDSIVELGGGNVILRGETLVPSTSGLFLVNISFSTAFRTIPNILSVNPNFFGRVNHILDVTTTGMSLVAYRSGSAKITDACQYLALGPV